jgi:uncharacterized OsmC-like protein
MTSLRSLRSRTVAGSHFRQFTHIRDLPVLIVDEPSGIPDAEPAPEPLEVLLAALGSDLAIGIRANAVARGIAVSSLVLNVEADIVTAPMDMTHSAPLGLEEVRVAVHIDADVPREALAALVARATFRSAVANTLHDGAQLSVVLAPPKGA